MVRNAWRAAAALGFFALFSFDASAAELGSGTLSLSDRRITLPPRLYQQSNPTGSTTGIPAGGLKCNVRFPCDFYTLTVQLPAGHMVANPSDRLRITASWPQLGPGNYDASDFDLTLFDQTGLVDLSEGQGGTTGDPEVIEVAPQDGIATYRIRVVPYLVPLRGKPMTLELELLDGAPPNNSTVSLGGPRFENYVAPDGYLALEPTLDVNLNTDHALLLLNTSVLKAVWDDSVFPPSVSWTDVTDPLAQPISADPILVGDQYKMSNGKPNSRIWVAQLLGATSDLRFSDDEGKTWKRSQGGGQPHGYDNESLAAGPWPAGKKPLTALHDHALYYCSQMIANALCSRSDNGGLTFTVSRQIFPVDGFCGNHGHVKVGADGTVYVPMNNTCQGSEGVAISTDAGLTWSYVKVPNTVLGRWDSSIGIASDGKTIYYGYAEQNDDRPMILKGTLDKTIPNKPTIRWHLPAVDVGAPLGIKNIAFNTVVAGDPARAAYAFHGTVTPGDSGSPAAMQNAVWHLYVATTFDGGATWNLRNATPVDPVQKGAICDHGAACDTETRPPDRNLLDFMDMVADSRGRIVIGYADGCTGACVAPSGVPNYAQLGVIARQTNGKRLYAAFDPPAGGLPGAPALSGVRFQASVNLAWAMPDEGGSAIAGYRVERSVDSGAFALIGSPTMTKFTDDTAVDPSASYRYRVAAINANGTGPFSAVFTPQPPAEDACTPPGLTILSDPEGDILNTGLVPSLSDPKALDVLRLSVAQPYFADGIYRIAFTLRMKDLSLLTPATTWPVEFSTSNGENWEIRMSLLLGAGPSFELVRDPAGAAELIPDAVEGSYTPAGVIAMTVKAADIGLTAPGSDELSAFLTRILLGVITPDNMPNDLAPAGLFETVSAQDCAPNAAPVSSLIKSTDHGPAPLLVNFDASGSYDPDAPADTIARYVFEFGDGSQPVSSMSPYLSHTYTTPGTYGARVRVVDSRGKPSANADGGQVVVE